MSTRFLLVVLLLAFCVVPLDAQQPDSGTVDITVREAMGMVDGILIRSDTISVRTDASGRARLVLPAGQHTLVVTRLGFVPNRLDVMVVADSTVSVTIDVAMEDKMAAEMEPVTITA